MDDPMQVMSNNKLSAMRRLVQSANGNLMVVQEAIGTVQRADPERAPTIERVEAEIRTLLAGRRGKAA